MSHSPANWASDSGVTSFERRFRQRFPSNLELRFTVNNGGRSSICGRGTVVNISSSGVAFRTETALLPDMNIHAKMEWPVALSGDCLLRVAMEGRIVRVETGLAVMSIHGHQFRTGGRRMPANSRPEPPNRGSRTPGGLRSRGSEQFDTAPGRDLQIH